MSCAEGVPETAEGKEKRGEVPDAAVIFHGGTTKDLHFDGSSADPCSRRRSLRMTERRGREPRAHSRELPSYDGDGTAAAAVRSAQCLSNAPVRSRAISCAVRPSIWWRSSMKTSRPFLSRPIDGED